jgi:hypothetical protein
MFKSVQTTSHRFIRSANASRTFTSPNTRSFQTTVPKLVSAKMDAYKKAGNSKDAPPKHEMVHFPGLLSEQRSFGDFRTVLHTGLYSQVVAMEVPVGGDIGDEVCYRPSLCFRYPADTDVRSTPSTKSSSLHPAAASQPLQAKTRKSRPVTLSSFPLAHNISLSPRAISRSSSSPSTRPQSISPRACTRRRKRATKPRMMRSMLRPSGARRARTTTRRRGLLRRAESTR